MNDQIGVITNYFPTVYDAIRSAGGISPYSNLKEVEIIRKNVFLLEEEKKQY